MDFRTWTEVDKEAPNTLAELLPRYLDEVSIKKKGHQDEVYRMNKLIKHDIGQVPLERLTPTMLASWRDKRLESVPGPTVRKDLGTVNHAINLAIREWGIGIRINPLSKVSKPAPNRARDRRLQKGEYEILMQALGSCRNIWIKPIVIFAIETAMRRGEILSLSWENVDVETRVAFLPETKNGESRYVPLSEKALTTLRGLSGDKGKVFDKTAYSVRMAFDRAVARVELVGLRFHDLRHEAISRLFEKKLNIMEVSAISGHKDLAMLKRYTHLKAENLAKRP